MHRTTRLKVTDINQHFICVLCEGYIIDATTIVECLHSFCRTCIVNFLDSSKFCPVCEVQVHKTKPLESLMLDRTLQDVIYKLIPGLYEKEMDRRREFYAEHPEAADKSSTEERCFYSPKELISVTLEYFKGSENRIEESESSTSEATDKNVMTRHFNCPAAVAIANLKKLIRNKFSLPPTYVINVMYADQLLSDDYTLMDIAYIYSWRRAAPMKFYYTFAPRKYMMLGPTFPRVEATIVNSTASSEILKQEPEAPTSEAAIPSVPDETDVPQPLPPPSSDEPEKMETEETIEPPTAAVEIPMQTTETTTEEATVSLSSTTDPPSQQTTEVVQPEIPNPSPIEPPVSAAPTVELSNHVHVNHHPSAVVPTPNGLKLKLVPLPDARAKSRKSTGRKGGRTRYRSAPVQNRFPRLAPYPPPGHAASPATCLASVPTTCLASTPMSSQLAVRKYVPNVIPSVMTSIAPNLMLSFVSSTANSLCNVNKNTAVLPAVQPAIISPSTNVNGQDKVPSIVPEPLPATVSDDKDKKSTTDTGSDGATKPQDVISEGQPKCNGVVAVSEPSVASRPAFYPPPQQTPPAISMASSPLGPLAVVKNNSQAPFVMTTHNSSLMAALVSPTVTSSNMCNVAMSNTVAASPVSKMEEMVNGTAEKKFPEPSMPILQTVLCDDKVGKKSPHLATEAGKVDCNGRETPVLSKDSAFCDKKFSPDKKTSFEMSVKNSISAEFSDNDDLGCQPDLVVDEQKMEEDSSEEEDLRKKITAIANEKEDEDSGRASDISSQARSSCDDEPSNSLVPTSSPRLPSFSLATTVSSDSNRTVKSNNINHVINNLLRNHEQRKDSMGALDLSTCTKKPGEGPSRPKPVANPVLDIKHRQQTYLPAPNSNSKQHTACVPSPKHPTSSPILMHGLTTPHPSLTPLQISAIRGKSPHLPVPPFHGTMMYTSQSSRTVPSSPTYVPTMACTSQSRTVSSPVRSVSSMFNSSAHPAFLTGVIPRMSTSAFPPRSATPSAMRNNFGPMSLSPTNPLKGATSSNHRMASSPRNSFSPANHLKATSPPQSPYTKGANSKSNSVSGYKKSNHSSAFPCPAKKPTHSYKSYNTKFKSSGNLAVINPDPNGSLHKLVIRNLDARPTSPQSQKL